MEKIALHAPYPPEFIKRCSSLRQENVTIDHWINQEALKTLSKGEDRMKLLASYGLSFEEMKDVYYSNEASPS